VYAIMLVQWSLLTGAALIPRAGFLLVCKPTIGLALFAVFPRWKTALAIALLLGSSVLIWPRWIIDWRTALAGAPNAIAPVTLWSALSCCSRYSSGGAPSRLLAALACVPHTDARL
jgi:hypothetical protein